MTSQDRETDYVLKSWHLGFDSDFSSDNLLMQFEREYPSLTFEQLIGNVSHGVMCPDYFAKAMLKAYALIFRSPGGTIVPQWQTSAGNGPDALIMYQGKALVTEIKWSCLAEVGVSVGWQWKTTMKQKGEFDIAILFGHLAFQPWMLKKVPLVVRNAVEKLQLNDLDLPKLSDHPLKWLRATKVAIYDRTQARSGIPPSKLQVLYKNKMKKHGDDHLHPTNVIKPCTSLIDVYERLLACCKRLVPEDEKMPITRSRSQSAPVTPIGSQ